MTVDVAYTYSTAGCSVTDATITITVNGGTPNYQYSIDGGTTFQPTPSTTSSTYTYTGLSQGFYSVVVRYGIDANTCELSYPLNPIIINDNGAALYTVATTNVTPCYDNSNGTITINVTSGTGPFLYSIDGGITYTSSNVFTGLSAGTYEVKVVTGSETTPCTSNAYATISQPAELTFGVVTYDACNSVGGSLAFSYPSGGTPPYEYFINYGATSSANPQFLNLAPGTYSGLYMTDTLGCLSPVYTSTLTIGNVTLTITQSTDVTCYGGTDGSFTFTTLGSILPYRLSTDGGNTWSNLYTTTLTGLPAGSYRIAVQNSTQTCRVQVSVTINQPTIVQLTASSTNPLCYGSSTGTILIRARGGTPPYSFSITGSTGTFYSGSESSYTFTGLPEGSYIAYVKDVNGCMPGDGVPLTLTQPTPVTINFVTATNINCYGQSTGKIVIGASGGTGLIQFSITGSSGPYQLSNTFTGLAAGTYSIAAQDANLCLTTSTVSLTQPAAPLTITSVVSTPVELCYGDNNGSIDISVAGGTSPYQYSINGGTSWSPSTTATSYTFSNLYAGTYTIAVLDFNLCTTTYDTTITLTQPIQLIISSVLVTSVTGCNSGTNGSIEITATGGTPGYQYSINGGSTWVPTYTTADVSWTFTGLGINTNGSKNYTVAVRDSNLCQTEQIVTLIGPAIIVVTSTRTNITCHDFDNGKIVVHATGGTPAYEYELTSSFITYPYQSSTTFTGLSAGAYTPYVMDANGCIENGAAVTIVNPTQLVITDTAQTNVLCYGGSTGQIIVTASGGTGALEYSKSGTSGPFQGSNTFDNLTSGTYYIDVQDANLCQTPTIAMYISQPAAPLTISVTSTNVTLCYGDANGSIGITTSGGTPNYTFKITNGITQWSSIPTLDTSWTFTGLPAGNYTATVLDQNSCSTNATVTLTQPSEIIVTTTKSNISCYNNNDGTITISASNGAPGYQYSITGSTSWVPTYTTDASYTFTGLVGGIYTPYVQDSNGCVVSGAAVTIVNPAPITISGISTINILCYGADTGQITVTASGGTAPLSYSINGTSGPYQLSNTFSNLYTGTYSIVVEDVNLCPTATATIYISQPTAPLNVTASSTNITCHGLTNGTIILSATGGTGTYHYSINGGLSYQLSNTFTGLSAGTYATEVKDTNSCQASGPIVIIVNPSAVTISGVIKTNVTCFGGDNGSLTITATGGTGALSYSINGISGPYQSSNIFDNLTSGTYHIAVEDVNDCVATYTTPIVITQAAQITFSLIIGPVTCPGGANGVITVTNPQGAGGPYHYSLNGGSFQSSNVFDMLQAGTYTVTVQDVNGCTSSNIATITQPAPIVITISNIIQPVCPTSDGSFTVTVTGGTPYYTIFLNNIQTATTSGQVTLTVTPGTYDVSVTDAAGCTQSYSPAIVIDEPPIFFITAINTDETTCINNDAIITTSVIGGQEPYTYYLEGPMFNITYGPTSDLSYTFTALMPGVYITYVIDDRGCTSNQVMLAISAMDLDFYITLSVTEVTCFGFDDGSITISAFDIHPTHTIFAYSIDNGMTWTNDGVSYTFDNLIANTYEIVVKDLTDLCETSTFVILGQPTQLNLTITSTQPVLCFGYTTSMTFEANGGVPPYDAFLDGNLTTTGIEPHDPVTITVTAGNHQLAVQDQNGCSTSLTFTIFGPDQVNFTTTSSNVSCNGGSDGSITIYATGGNGQYYYFVNGVQYGPAPSPYMISNLSTGTYSITVEDTNLCPASNTQTVTITQPQPVVCTILSITAPTFTGDGSVTVNISGGTPPYTVTCAGQHQQAQENEPITFYLPTGTYQLTVLDSNGCCPPATRAGESITRDPGACQIFIINIPDPQAPSGLRCCQLFNKFPLCGDLVNVVSWSSYAGAVGYVVASDPKHRNVLAFVTSNQPLVYRQHCCKPGVTNTYYIFAVDQNGNYTQPSVILS